MTASIDQVTRLLRLLADHPGGTVERLLDSQDLLRMLLEVDPSQIDRRRFGAAVAPFDPASVFASPTDMATALRRRAEWRSWPLAKEQIDVVCGQLLQGHSSGLRCLSVDIWLGDLQTTYIELWLWMCDVHRYWPVDTVSSGADQLRLLDVGRYGAEPEVKTVELDLGGYWTPQHRCQHSPESVRHPDTSPGLEVLAAAALHPEWLVRMGTKMVPRVWLPGLQVNDSSQPEWSGVPVLDWHRDRAPYVGAESGWIVSPARAIPTLISRW
ncbi:MAG TPA: hypothetical protein VK694_03730 [Verrucomicrobiae bacterium]|nr:hypothetical protein [Verrucomicrobiae bacterium]